MDNKILSTIIDRFKGGPVGLTTLATAVTAIDASITQLLKDNPHTNSPIGIEKLRNNKRKLHAQINNIVENMSN